MEIDTNLDNCLPHYPPMRLIDSIILVNDKLAQCEAVVRENNIFYDPAIAGIYSWVGFELMSQTLAVFAHKQNPKPAPQIGFLISVRKFSCKKLYFKVNDFLIITAENIYMHEGIGAFNCRIELNNNILASASLNAIQVVR